MRGGDQSLAIGLVYTWQADRQIGGDAIAALRSRAEADGRGHRGVCGNTNADLARYRFHRAEEAGRIAGCEQFFRIGADTAWSAHLLGYDQFDVDRAIV